MKSLTDAIKEHLRANEVVFYEQAFEDCDAVLIVPYRGTNCEVWLGVQTYDKDRRISFCVFNGLKVPPHRTADVYEFVSKANLGLPLGAFWLDPDTGDIRLTVTAAVADMEPTNAYFQTHVCNALRTYDRFVGALCSVIYAGVAPDEALAKAEGPSNDEVAKTVSKLMSSVHDRPQSPSNETDHPVENRDASKPEKELHMKDKPRKPRTRKSGVVIRLSSSPDIVAKITQEDLDQVIGEVEKQNDSASGKEGKTDEAA